MSRGRPRHLDVLTPAEWQVLFFVRKGLSNRAIAEKRGTSRDAVKYHVSNLLSKLELSSRLELAEWDGRPSVPVASGGSTMPIREQASMVYVDDLATSIAFYRDALGFEVAHMLPEGAQPGSAGLVNGAARLILHQRGWHATPQPGEQQPPASSRAASDNVLMLYVEDSEAFRADLEERGYFESRVDTGDASSFYVADPDGNEIQVLSSSLFALDFGDVAPTRRA